MYCWYKVLHIMCKNRFAIIDRALIVPRKFLHSYYGYGKMCFVSYFCVQFGCVQFRICVCACVFCILSGGSCEGTIIDLITNFTNMLLFLNLFERMSNLIHCMCIILQIWFSWNNKLCSVVTVLIELFQNGLSVEMIS